MQIKQRPHFKLVDNYLMDETQLLGSGTYGRVFAATDVRFNLPVAIKVVQFKNLTLDLQKFLGSLRNQIRNMQIVDHINIVKLHDVKKSSSSLYMICEFCNGGSLEALMRKGKLPEEEVVRIMREIAAGYKCLIQHGIVHRDLKPANILIHNDTIKIADFGFSKLVVNNQLDQPLLSSWVGSPQYMSPQILRKQKYSSKCDIWSMGMILYELIVGRQSWTGKDPADLLSQIQSKKLSFPSSIKVSQPLRALVEGMLQPEQEDRLSWDKLFEIPLLGQPKADDLSQTIKTLSKSSQQNRLRDLLKLYYQNNKVIRSVYQCERKGRLNKQLVNTQQQQPVESPAFTDHLSVGMSLQQIYSRQKKQIIQRKNIEKVISYFLQKRNRAAFYSLLGVTLLTQSQGSSISRKSLEVSLFPVFKLATRTFFKIYRRIKDNDPQKYLHYTKEDWASFQKSKERNILLNFIKYDFTVVKLYFDELLRKLGKAKEQKPDSPEDQLFIRSIVQLEPILNNKLCQKPVVLKVLAEKGSQLLGQIGQTKDKWVWYLKQVMQQHERLRNKSTDWVLFYDSCESVEMIEKIEL